MHKSIRDIVSAKNSGKKITALTSFDYTLARMCDAAGTDILLVGDSAGMVALGYDDTTRVTMDQIACTMQALSCGFLQYQKRGVYPRGFYFLSSSLCSSFNSDASIRYEFSSLGNLPSRTS